MSPRAIRRAAERKARKSDRKLEMEQELIVGRTPSSAPGVPARPSSPAQLAANRANAQLSTGPSSEAGKTRSSLNAVKTGLTGRTVLLSSEDAESYRRHIAAYEAEYRPVGLRECELVQSLADTQWRLNRIPGLESAIYALGHVETGETDDRELLSLQTHLKYEKQLRNLQLQEGRLLRRYRQEMAELRALQKEREQKASELASNFEGGADGRVAPSANSSQKPLCLAAPLPTPPIDPFALPSSPCGNFRAPANVD